MLRVVVRPDLPFVSGTYPASFKHKSFTFFFLSHYETLLKHSTTMHTVYEEKCMWKVLHVWQSILPAIWSGATGFSAHFSLLIPSSSFPHP